MDAWACVNMTDFEKGMGRERWCVGMGGGAHDCNDPSQRSTSLGRFSIKASGEA